MRNWTRDFLANFSRQAMLLGTAVIATTSLAACGKFGYKSQSNSETDSDSQGVLVAQSLLLNASKPVVVCWSSNHPSQAEFRKDVENHVITNFARTRKLRIQKGWKNCSSLSGKFDIGVVVYDDPAFQTLLKSNKTISAKLVYKDKPGNPRVRNLGKDLKGDPYGMILNTSSLGRDDAKVRLSKLTQQGLANYALSAALHEFGHAAGLRHEHAHPESECTIFTEDLGRTGLPIVGRAVTPYDRNSIMNYCRFAKNKNEYTPDLNQKIFHFSDGDIATLNKGY